MTNKQFLTPLVLAMAFLMPSLGQAWSFIEPQDRLSKSDTACWQVMTVQDQTCVGDDCPQEGGTELPPETEEEPDCE